MIRKLIFVLILIFGMLLVYYPHYDYKYPLHVDEWHHLSQSRSIYETGNLSNMNPQFLQGDFYINHENGFQIFLVEFLWGFGLNPILFFKFLPAIFLVLGCLSIFYLTDYFFKKYWISILSMVFYISLKTNVNIYGPWFFVPLTFALPFVAMFVVTFFKGIRGDFKYLIISGIFGILILLSHPITLTFLFPIFFIYFLISKEKHKNFWAFVFFILTILGATLIQFEFGWGMVEINYLIPEFFGWGATLMALIGIVYSLKREKYFFAIWVIVLLILMYIYVIFGKAYLAPYQRLVFYLLLGMIPLAALGVYTVFKKVPKVAAIIILLAVLFFSFYNYFDLPSNARLYYLVYDTDYDLIEQIPANSLVMASKKHSTAIYPISGAKVYGIIVANLKQEDEGVINKYFDKPCESDLEFDYVYTDTALYCDNLEIYAQQEGSFLYKRIA